MLAGCTVDFKDQMQNDECKAAACFAHKSELAHRSSAGGRILGPKEKRDGASRLPGSGGHGTAE